MFKFVAIFALATISCTMAEPKPGVLAAPLLAAPAVAPAVVTAQSSQVFARNYNALAAPLVAAPAPVVAAAPVVRAAAPLLAAAPAPYFASPYLASPYAAAPLVL
ncbi:uncharacterized protein LOC143203437 [Rhynchophorus ferrugineus]|uniref:Uncharacterized protein n=1 Tax=Rhynchophorus ferrugineus TaxID=354439 RepID=A0A834HME4_RHYFE|nr:hypothetical protein GWI33_000803 [Rhynchophorus ferrugineus]KAF7263988.1 hypothetical protein GWI33_000786 [Rhynchophorus ferrugineus]